MKAGKNLIMSVVMGAAVGCMAVYAVYIVVNRSKPEALRESIRKANYVAYARTVSPATKEAENLIIFLKDGNTVSMFMADKARWLDGKWESRGTTINMKDSGLYVGGEESLAITIPTNFDELAAKPSTFIELTLPRPEFEAIIAQLQELISSQQE